MSDYGFSYGAGMQFNPIENVALDFSYEQSRIRNVDVGTGSLALVTASNRFGDIKIRLTGADFFACNARRSPRLAAAVSRRRALLVGGEQIGTQMGIVHFL